MFVQCIERKRKLHFFDCGLKSLYIVTVTERVWETVPESNFALGKKLNLMVKALGKIMEWLVLHCINPKSIIIIW